ncbi:protein EMSY-LIKE 3-like [Impatiens glandulifera]|uniref:protein EMSY-LIKE 3-like n=1 Tax=Impatiens glandulifera TaxID=253017 RepID=UPI001FB0F1BC|nr:protein EMSY-LIKE 3-like [Impatiens glandulifera]
MDYDDDSSGTDDDLPPPPPPPPRRNRFTQGGVRVAAGNSISEIQESGRFPRTHADMENKIHAIELEAYISILRAFKAQSDAITWEKESLITELRKELRVSDEEHRRLLSKVNADDVIGRIRDWRKTGGGVRNSLLTQPGHNQAPSPTVSGSHKKQKTSQTGVCLPQDAPTPTFRQSIPPSGGRGKKSNSIPVEDNAWDVESRGISRKSGGTVPGHASKKSSSRDYRIPGKRDAGTTKIIQRKQFPSSRNLEKKALTDIELLHTDTLIKQVEKVFSGTQPNPVDIEKARKAIKDHEEALINAIALIGDLSEGEYGPRDKVTVQDREKGNIGAGNGHDDLQLSS